MLTDTSVSSHGRRVTWLELFFDLIFVAAVTQVAEPLREHYSFGEVARLTPLFLLICWAWKGQAVYATRFGRDTTTDRVVTLVQMFTVAALSANAKDTLGSESTAGFVAGYAVIRLVLVAQYRARHERPCRRRRWRRAIWPGTASPRCCGWHRHSSMRRCATPCGRSPRSSIF